MTCQQYRDTVCGPIFYPDLSYEQRMELDQHMYGCPDCQKWTVEQDAIDTLVHGPLTEEDIQTIDAVDTNDVQRRVAEGN